MPIGGTGSRDKTVYMLERKTAPTNREVSGGCKLWCMGILGWLKLRMWRKSMRCRWCDTPLQGLNVSCTSECAVEIEWMDALP